MLAMILLNFIRTNMKNKGEKENCRLSIKWKLTKNGMQAFKAHIEIERSL